MSRRSLFGSSRVVATLGALAASIAAAAAWSDAGAQSPTAEVQDRSAEDRRALRDRQSVVGSWRGAGQVERGSAQGAWAERIDWAWRFADGRATLALESPDGKHWRRATLSPGDKAGDFALSLEDPAGVKRRFVGGLADERLILTAVADASGKPPADGPARITVRQVAEGDRLLVLFEKAAADGRFVRLAEVGYTREGSAFGKGGNGPECIVTGGLATMTVEHAGKSYPVCCSGCRDLFNEDPAKIVAEWQARQAAAKSSAGKATK